MNKKEKIEQEIQKTLAQFDKAEKLPANPYFYTRVQAGLEESRKERHVFMAVLKPAFFTVLVVLNVTTAFWYMDNGEQISQTDTHSELTEILSSDLKLDTDQDNLFDIN